MNTQQNPAAEAMKRFGEAIREIQRLYVEQRVNEGLSISAANREWFDKLG